jgi:hypothetical protein
MTCETPIDVTTTVEINPAELEIEAYRKRIENLADLNSGESFTNNQPAHARVIFETFFCRATQEVDIFCRNLAADVFDSVRLCENLIGAVKRGVKVRVFTQENPAPSSFVDTLQELIAAKPELVELKKGNSNSLNSLGFNFAVMDGKAYRFEPNKDDFVAFASMNNPSVCKSLLSVFRTAEASYAL